MTNGEKLQSVFPDTKIITQFDNPFGDRFILFTLNNEDMQVNIDWWNAEYKELPTKNDLAVDCIDRKATLDAIIKRLGIKNEAYLLEAERAIYQQILAMPSVAPQLSSELEKNSKKLEKNFGELDCISREDALMCLTGEFEDRQYEPSELVSIFSNRIKHLSSVTPQPRWIPVSERLPEKSGDYWCTFGGTNLTGSDYYTTESDAKKLFDDPEEYAGWRSQNVIAWMPLHLPWKREVK